VDRYENYLHITEYERPSDRDLARHRAWLDLMREAASECLSVPLENTFLKQRRKGDTTGQYQKLDDDGRRVVVHEGGLKFLVNFSDYVDTGLFLDHRVARKMVMEEAAGKRMLNLFAYTGAFSVYAAAGGAKSTTTVDLSRTYLDWAGQNFQVNDLGSAKHQFIASDTIEFLETSVRQKKQYDLVVCDPPTYSKLQEASSIFPRTSDGLSSMKISLSHWGSNSAKLVKRAFQKISAIVASIAAGGWCVSRHRRP